MNVLKDSPSYFENEVRYNREFHRAVADVYCKFLDIDPEILPDNYKKLKESIIEFIDSIPINEMICMR